MTHLHVFCIGINQTTDVTVIENQNRNLHNTHIFVFILGSKLVFQPLFDIAECNAGRYQPIIFTTHGNSECIFFQSTCVEEGRTVYSYGSSSNDIACQCDYTQGYTFISKPQHNCFCLPSEEDCSCFRSKCSKLSAGSFDFYINERNI